MSYRKDIIPLPEDFQFNMFRSSGTQEQSPELHFHDCLEINFIESGVGENIIEDKRYTLEKGDLYIINNLEHHMAVSNGDLKMLVIVFDPVFVWQNDQMDSDYLKPFFNRNFMFSNKISEQDLYYKDIKSIVEKLDQEWVHRQEGYRMVIRALLMHLLALLYRHFKSRDEIGEDVRKFQQMYDRIRGAVAYIHHNYTQDIKLEVLANVALMNRTYFSSYFKSVMKVTVPEYIESMRIRHSCRLLKTTQKSITEISADSGFNSVSYFNKAFKKHIKITPNNYRYADAGNLEN